eukprot:COSAG02_NODE_131_length_34710_cov_17.171159_34_plen_71_part_00
MPVHQPRPAHNHMARDVTGGASILRKTGRGIPTPGMGRGRAAIMPAWATKKQQQQQQQQQQQGQGLDRRF